MKPKHLLSTLYICAMIFVLAACGNHSKGNGAASTDVKDTLVLTQPTPAANTTTTPAAVPVFKPGTSAANKYKELRLNLFTVNLSQLNIKADPVKDIVYGVIFDQENHGTITTIACYQNGDVTLLRNTDGVSKNFKANIAAIQFVDKAKTNLVNTTKAHDTSLPGKGMVKFYLLTNKGICVATEDINNITSKKSPWTGLFDEGNKVLAELK